MDARVDLHVHSRFSGRPTEWLLRRLGSGECYTSPREVYEACRARGMRFVTITDHDTLDGASELLGLPDTFLSCEVTAAFPEDGCEVHVLVWGLDEAQHAEIQRLRRDLYALRDYLLGEPLAHAVAHPLSRVDDRFSLGHFERLVVLFKAFEGLNGARDPREGMVVRAVLSNLNPALLADLADRHRLDPRDAEPWRKHITGGSDDHGGLYVASAWSETPQADNVAELLEHLRAGRVGVAGEPGSSLRLGRSLQRIAQRYLAERLRQGDGGRLLDELLGRLVAGQAPAARDRLRLVTAALPRPRAAGRGLATMAKVLAAIPGEVGRDGTSERRSFELASRLGQTLAWETLAEAMSALRQAQATDAAEALGTLPAAALAMAPYLAAFHSQHRDEPLLRAAAERFPAARLLRDRGERWAWCTDATLPGDSTLRPLLALADLASRRRESAVVLTCGEPVPAGLSGRSFADVGALEPAEAAGVRLRMPPLLEVVEHCERERLEEVVVATPGPMGVAGWLAARLLRLRLVVLHQLDLPGLVRQRTGSATLEQLAWEGLAFLWRDADLVLVADGAEASRLVARGVDPGKLRVLPRAVDRRRFSPEQRDGAFWGRHDLDAGCKLLRVGPVLADAPTVRLIEAVRDLAEEGHAVQLVLVGDGPGLRELARRHRHPAIAFLGALDEQDVAAAYASADLLVEPDAADLRAHRVCEALASGLPALVDAAAAGASIVRGHGAGLVVPMGDPCAFRDALRLMVVDAPRRTAAARSARQAASALASWEESFAAFWAAPSPPPTLPRPRFGPDEDVAAAVATRA